MSIKPVCNNLLSILSPFVKLRRGHRVQA